MDDKDFIFSLYPNDLIHIVSAKKISLSAVKGSTLESKIETNDAYLYYKKTNISTGAISVITHDNSHEMGSLGVRTLLKIEKCVVDPLGNISLVKKEKRQSFR